MCMNCFLLLAIVHDSHEYACAKGSCQVKIIPKIREKLGLVRQQTPIRLSNFLFCFETIGNMKTNHKCINIIIIVHVLCIMGFNIVFF